MDEESSRRSAPESRENLLKLGFQHLEEGQPHEALRLADEAVSLDETFAEAHEVRALALTMLGRIPESDGAFSRAAELDPEQCFRPFRLERAAFDDAVETTLLRLPTRFREYLERGPLRMSRTLGPRRCLGGVGA